jgi:hypothetical protein
MGFDEVQAWMEQNGFDGRTLRPPDGVKAMGLHLSPMEARHEVALRAILGELLRLRAEVKSMQNPVAGEIPGSEGSSEVQKPE